tara:strand:+ start:422 stop:568 length:147 start_codon:yes stop_codon:yes gene_type:complete
MYSPAGWWLWHHKYKASRIEESASGKQQVAGKQPKVAEMSVGQLTETV